MEFHVSLDGRHDLSGQIYRQIRTAILDGRLQPGEPLPPTRELARRLEVSRNTVGVAYDRLTGEGFLASRVGAGTYVDALAGRSRHPGRGVTEEGSGRQEPSPGQALRPRAGWDDVPRPPAPTAEPAYDFRAGIPDARLFPFESWRRLMSRELRPSAVRTAMYGEPAGHLGLRTAIARHIGVSRAVRTGADDLVITNGAQQAIDLIGRVLLEPGDCVAVEEPGYPPPRQLLRSLGARVVPVPVDAEGLVVEALPDEARMVYVSPSHQFPLGMPMSLSRRIALLSWAERRGAAVVEDDYDSEFRFGGRPLDTLKSLDAGGHVIYVGTFSKTMLPTLRLGFLVAPPPLRQALRAAKYLSDWHASLPAQAALARFVDEGLFVRHIRRMRNEYQDRHRRITDLLTRQDGWLRPIPSTAGIHLSALLPEAEPLETATLLRRLRAAGVAAYPLSRFYAGRPDRTGLVLGYGAIPPERIEDGLRLLRRCLE
ncbi:MocR-like pyridoxine biosynthesis transcription factor PdxR [Streptosporangium sp. NBC_01756]|uniref:MocR-like pyridoxine biosynthesis transcription factor PdxR n=1 Tax=Streptosporangium sp. NBC_01756 TaxID=2975950 RepID=UPI002DDB800C|nr:PLP-dependent aminotransferase family protein [Streptosporangium sp. NBC_01756]WSC83098.1 PLP-dependent aminotransferase family protein [Streptosporangium sp. NBC_01756]